MNYEKYFDSLIEKDLYTEKDEIFRILTSEYDNASIIDYDGIDEVAFEFLLALNEKRDFTSIVKLKEVLTNHYKEVYDSEYGQFADILIPYYISVNQDQEAKLLFNEWIEKDYDYDSILILLNRLAHYGKEAWIDEYIKKEYNKIKVSSKLMSGAEEDLIIYKIIIEIGKINNRSKSINEVIAELSEYELELTELHKQIFEEDRILDFRKEKRLFVFKILNEFQKYLNSKYNIPYVQSGIIMNTLAEFYENSKHDDVITYFKISESSFAKYMSENSINGLSFNKESNYAMLYLLPIFFSFLKEKKVFSDTDLKREKSKVANLLNKYRRKYTDDSWVLDELKSYKMITAANNSGC